jgi:uncharacterized membrane protein YhdT
MSGWCVLARRTDFLLGPFMQYFENACGTYAINFTGAGHAMLKDMTIYYLAIMCRSIGLHKDTAVMTPAALNS